MVCIHATCVTHSLPAYTFVFIQAVSLYRLTLTVQTVTWILDGDERHIYVYILYIYIFFSFVHLKCLSLSWPLSSLFMSACGYWFFLTYMPLTVVYKPVHYYRILQVVSL